MSRSHSSASKFARTACASRMVISTMWTTIIQNDVKPSHRCLRARSPWPQTCSTQGILAISSTCSNRESEDTRPVSPPSDVVVPPI